MILYLSYNVDYLGIICIKFFISLNKTKNSLWFHGLWTGLFVSKFQIKYWKEKWDSYLHDLAFNTSAITISIITSGSIFYIYEFFLGIWISFFAMYLNSQTLTVILNFISCRKAMVFNEYNQNLRIFCINKKSRVLHVRFLSRNR